MRQLERSTVIWVTGRLGSTPWPTRVQVGLSEVTALGLTDITPSSVPTYTPSPPSAEPIALIRQPRAPLGAEPAQPVVRSGLMASQCTSPADGASALFVRYNRNVPRNIWLVCKRF